jgi:ADP-ribose pyrophosphatase YjhB (NUDIX family)
MFKIKNNLFCINCGKTNHKYNNCNDPITSYGLICYYENKIVLVRRKYTFAYMDFIMGKYDVNNIKYLVLLFSRMTKTEITNILNDLDFDLLRNSIGLNNYTRYHKQEYENSKLKFTYIKKLHIIEDIVYIIDQIFDTEFIKVLMNNTTYKLKNNEFKVCKELIIKIKKLINTKKIYDEPEWEIPKGKRNDKESNINTAIREFVEESNLTNIIVYKNIIPLEEEFTAINNNRYKHVYYLSCLKNISTENTKIDKNIILPVNTENSIQCREISMVGLISIDSVEDYLRPYQVEKKKVIYKSYQIFNGCSQFFY